MAGLPHFNSSTASTSLYEPVQGSLFEVTILPVNIDAGLIMEHVTGISGLGGVNPSVDAVGQKYKFADRSYASMPTATMIDVTINFTLNLNDSNQVYVYKTLRDWYKLVYDPETGEMGLKKDYVGTVIIVQYNRAGDIFRKLTLLDCFPTGSPAPFDALSYDANDPMPMDYTIRCDHWTEELT